MIGRLESMLDKVVWDGFININYYKYKPLLV